MISKVLYVFVILSAPLIAGGQNKTFTSAKVGRVNQFTSKSDTISFSEYIETKPGTSERFVFINSDQYKFVRTESKGVHTEEIFDKSGSKIATVPLSGADRNSMVLKDGDRLKFVSTGKTTWAYTNDGKDAIKAFYYLLNDQKHYVVQWDDPTITNPLVPAIVLEHGLTDKHVYRNKKRTAAILTTVGVSSMLVLIRIAMDEDDF